MLELAKLLKKYIKNINNNNRLLEFKIKYKKMNTKQLMYMLEQKLYLKLILIEHLKNGKILLNKMLMVLKNF